MQFNGRSVERYKGVVHIVRVDEDGQLIDMQIRVQQLPATWEKDTQRALPEPLPPIVGKVFDAAGKETPKYGTDDPTYVRTRGQWEDRRAALRIYDATIDQRITWQTDPQLRQSDVGAFADAIFLELAGSEDEPGAFSRGELNHWLIAINSIDSVGGADIALAEEGLLQLVQRVVGLPVVEAVQEQGGQ